MSDGVPQKVLLLDVLRRVAEAEKALVSARSSLVDLCKQESIATTPRDNALITHAVAQVSFKQSCKFLLEPSAHEDDTPKPPSEPLLEKEDRAPKFVDEIVTKCMDEYELGGSNGAKEGTEDYGQFGPTHQISGSTLGSAVSEVPNIRKNIMFVPVLAAGSRSIRLPILHPFGKFCLAWIFISVPLLVYEAFAIPYTIAFDEQMWAIGDVIDVFIILYYFADMFVTCFTAIVKKDGTVIVSHRLIVKRYLKSWFVFDLIAAIPWAWLANDLSALRLSKAMRTLHTTRVFHLIRLMKMMRMKGFSEHVMWYIEQNQLTMFIASVTKVLCMLFLVTHWAACMWYVVGDADYVLTWKKVYLDADDITKSRNRYIYALYFTLTTMTTVGYGDVTPQNLTEIVFVLFLLLIASFVFASLMGQVSDLVSNLNQHSHLKAQYKSMLTRYLRWRAVPTDLKKKLREHMMFVWESNGFLDTYEEKLMHQLHPHLKTELTYHLYGGALLSTPCFTWLVDYDACLKALANRVHAGFLGKEDHLFKKGEDCVQVHILLDGAVWLTQNDKLSSDTISPEEILLRSKGFLIPRNSPGGFVDFGRTVIWDGLSQLTRHKRRFSRRQVKGAMQATGLVHALARKIKFEDPDEVHLDVHDGVVKSAAKIMRCEDERFRLAAMRIQRAWRKWRYETKLTMSRARTGIHQLSNKMVSSAVRAPACLGESCLWQPYEKWSVDPPAKYMYSARCTVRCEILFVPRSSVHSVIGEFSPWLQDRLKCFQESIQRLALSRIKRET